LSAPKRFADGGFVDRAALLCGDVGARQYMGQIGNPTAEQPGVGLPHWHLASFRCDAEFGSVSAHIGHRVAIKLDLQVRALVLPSGDGSRLTITIGTILARIQSA
jgi:hypothetical protein